MKKRKDITNGHKTYYLNIRFVLLLQPEKDGTPKQQQPFNNFQNLN